MSQATLVPTSHLVETCLHERSKQVNTLLDQCWYKIVSGYHLWRYSHEIRIRIVVNVGYAVIETIISILSWGGRA